ncbi:MAG: hypothetical protein C0174_01640 [Thermodesulfobium narugense]|nr:MAG: hypothetical protein C0174_01640 [Thermodesulfobium narugense]
MIKKDEIIFLFGAGVSADAGIPTSSQMINKLEELISHDNDWSEFKDIYFLIKSGIYFSYGIQGEEPIFNIEILVNTLNELEKKEMHPLYPFIGSWSVKFNEVIGNNFHLIKDFRKKIIGQLKSWMQPSDLRSSSYLKKLKDFKDEFNFPIRIFTLNYDLLVENNLKSDLKIERGFDEDRKWNYKRFIESYEEPDIYLYKLHGSIDWRRDEKTQIVIEVDSVPEEPDLIFGTQYKMQYIDPYLFMISEFRHYCLKAKLIVSLGFSFSDEHINSILKQSLLTNNNTKIFALAYKEDPEKIRSIINNDRIQIINDKDAKTFFENDLKLEIFKEFFEQDEEGII